MMDSTGARLRPQPAARMASKETVYSAGVDFEQTRRRTITALFSDDKLLDLIVLKGGNAIRLVHRLSSRTSLDLDFSLERDFADLEEAKTRMFKALKGRFSAVGLIVFDEKFARRPGTQEKDQQKWWSGYSLSFKLIDRQKHAALGGDVEAIRRESLEIGPDHLRVFTVDFSSFEYCVGKTEVELDDYAIYVYSPPMIAIEKLRAICQQMPEYALRRYPRPRARDFFDIHELIVNANVCFGSPENLVLAERIFEAKRVPLELIPTIAAQQEFHRPDWPAVQASVPAHLKSYDYYFEFVVEQASALEPLWVK
jgi:hypothetical protein